MTQQLQAGPEREGRARNDNRARTAQTPVDHAPPREQAKPGLRHRWDTIQTSKTSVFWLLAAAIALTMVVGFMGAGWMTGGAAERAAGTTAQAAVVARLAPICVAQFNQDPQKEAKLAELQSASSHRRASYVDSQGWATMPGDAGPDRGVADACARLLMGE
jgi:hypothetical protein